MLASALTVVVAASPFTVGAPVLLAPEGVSPSIGCSPTECVVAWKRYDHGPAGDACVVIATFSAEQPTPVVSVLTCEGSNPSVATSPKATLVSWSTGKHLMGTAITNGRPGPIFKIPVEQRADSVDAAFDGQRFLLVWSTSKQVSMLRLSAEAQLLDEKPLVLATAPQLSRGSVGCVAGKCLVTHLVDPMSDPPRLAGVVVENGVPTLTSIAPIMTFEATVTTSGNALVALSTKSERIVCTSLDRSNLVFVSTNGRIRDLEAASFAERTLVGWVVGDDRPKATELMLLPVDGQTRGVVGASLAGEFDPSIATADGKTFWVVTSRWPEKNRGDWSTVVVRKLTVP